MELTIKAKKLPLVSVCEKGKGMANLTIQKVYQLITKHGIFT